MEGHYARKLLRGNAIQRMNHTLYQRYQNIGLIAQLVNYILHQHSRDQGSSPVFQAFCATVALITAGITHWKFVSIRSSNTWISCVKIMYKPYWVNPWLWFIQWRVISMHLWNNRGGCVHQIVELLPIRLRCASVFQTILPPKVFIYNRIDWEQAVSIGKADLDNVVFQFAGNTPESGSQHPRQFILSFHASFQEPWRRHAEEETYVSMWARLEL